MASKTHTTPLKPSWWWFVLISASYAAALVASLCYGAPKHLPGIALGLPVLLHLERAGAMVAVVAAVAVVAYLTRLGHLPTQLANVGYADLESRQKEGEDRQQEAERVTSEALLAVSAGLHTLEDWVTKAARQCPTCLG